MQCSAIVLTVAQSGQIHSRRSTSLLYLKDLQRCVEPDCFVLRHLHDVQRRERPRFQCLFTVSYGLGKKELEQLNFEIKYRGVRAWAARVGLSIDGSVLS